MSNEKETGHGSKISLRLWIFPDHCFFEKTTLAFMIIAIILEIVSLGCFVGLFSPRARLGMPAFSVTGLAFLSLFVAIVVYGVRMQYKVMYLQSTSYELLANVYLGYSYWIAVIAAIFLLISCSLSGTLIGATENTEHLH
ncbi:Protein CBG06953 [Caenorhabditis briggsae]|uniref:Protein CBG06953 n=1 Tax=Caenorhabditis briggsae TaxID=6238 RepID=A8X423_CAEBR|nr:Protein CBG06953 [Caenorhabditis briggsae]CAP27383.2 Protein CBG06953 [Caenorhabditis briggsae]